MTDTPKATNPLTRTAQEWDVQYYYEDHHRPFAEFIAEVVVPEVVAAAREGYVPQAVYDGVVADLRAVERNHKRMLALLEDTRRERDAARLMEQVSDDVALQYRRDWQQARADRKDAERKLYDTFDALADEKRSVAALRAQLAEAKREGAREALTRLHDAIAMSQMPGQGAERNQASSFDVEWFRDREYPAPSASPQEGKCEPWCKRPAVCAVGEGCHAEDKWGNRLPDAPAPEPPQEVVVPVEWFETPDAPAWTPSDVSRIRFTPAIVAQLLAMRPTQEGK